MFLQRMRSRRIASSRPGGYFALTSLGALRHDDKMKNVQKAISDFGGIPAVAKALKVPRTTVSSWFHRQRLPALARFALASLEKRRKK